MYGTMLLNLCASLFFLADCQCLFQVRYRSQKTHALSVQLPSDVSGKSLADIQDLARDLKFYMPDPTAKCHANLSDPVGFRPSIPEALSVDPGTGILAPVRRWLWANNENNFDSYVRHRLACSSSLVGSAEEADFCYPTCDAHQSLSLTKVKDEAEWMMSFCFEIPSARRAGWWNCESVCFQPEAYMECHIEVPYLHGVSWPSPYSDAPWESDFARKTMLVYFGGIARGHQRSKTLRMMEAAASNISGDSPESIFLSHLVHEKGNEISEHFTPPFYREAWELYASANFSWHPHGDTPTRRAVYDSIMFGCVPVVEETAAILYRRLFNGIMWSEISIPIEQVFVIIPAGMEQDGEGIVKLLASMSAVEIEQRRRNVALIAPFLQWGWNAPSDAFLMALGSFGSAAPKPLEGAESLLKALILRNNRTATDMNNSIRSTNTAKFDKHR